MKLSNYTPIFRGILFKEENQGVSKVGSLYLPDSASQPICRVVKVGAECLMVRPNDNIRVASGIRMEEIDLEEGKYFQVLEMQVIGIERDDSIRNAPPAQPTPSGGGELQAR